MAFLLDTNVISAARRPDRQDTVFQKFLRKFDMNDAFLSSVTIMEIQFGIQREQRRNPAFVVDLKRWLKDIVLVEFANRVISFDLMTALRAGTLPTPNGRPTVDAMIAATALENNLHVVTRNVGHFESLGVTCIDPWQRSLSD
jgi:predicted nucleic acid-binding protein